MSSTVKIEAPNSVVMSSMHSSFENPMLLRSFVASDLEDFYQWASDPDVAKFMMWDKYNSMSEAEFFFKNFIEKHSWFKAICYKGKVIGSISLDKGKGAHVCKAELGYVLAKEFWGKGLGTEAVRLAIQDGFTDLEVVKIEAFVDPDNIASQRILEKNGFEKEGYLRKAVVQKGVIRDRIVYSTLKA